MRISAGFILAVWGGLGCSSSKAPTTVRAAAAPSRPVQQYLPLQDDTISQFEMTTDGGDPGMFVLEISRPRDNLAELRIAGHVQRLQLEPTRIVHATGGTLLEEPLEVGHHFRGAFGEVTITDIHHSIQVPAGRYEQCLVTVEESTAPARRATSVYCKGVGLVALTVEAFEGEAGLIENRLTQHGPRFGF